MTTPVSIRCVVSVIMLFLVVGTEAFGASTAPVFDCQLSVDGGASFIPGIPHYPGTDAWVYLISNNGPVTVRINTTQTGALGTILPMYRLKSTALVNGYTQFIMNPGEHVAIDFGVALNLPRSYLVVAAPSISGASASSSILPTNLGNDYIISTPGTYYLQGSCTGNIDIQATGRVDIIGQDQAYLLGQVDTTRLNDGVINCSGSCEVHVRGVCVEIPDNGLFGIFLQGSNSSVQDCAVVSPNTANGIRGRGGIECGINGRISGCVIAPGDDAIRLCQPNTLATDCSVHMLGNGSLFQFGYNAKFNGAYHNADHITVFGNISNGGPTEQDGQPFQGRMAAGGQAPNSGSDINLTDVDVRLFSCNGLVNLATGNVGVTVNNINISATINNAALTLGESAMSTARPIGISAFTLLAPFTSSSISGVNINFGRGLPALQGMTMNHVWINGNVTGTVNGWSIVSPTIRTGTITGDTIAPSAPTDLSASASSNQATLTWANNSESDFSCYNVYRSQPAAGIGYQQIAAGLTTNTFSDTTIANGLLFSYTITAVDTSNNESIPSAPLSIVAQVSSPVISTASLPNGTVGTTYSQILAASNIPTSWTVSSGTLPAGLVLNASTGAITGTPNASGSSSLTFSATNADGTGTANLAIIITPAPPLAPVISSATTDSTTVGIAFMYVILASNVPTSFTATGLPSGLTLNTSTGMISGTPTASGSFTVALAALNAGGMGTATLVITVAPVSSNAPVISSVTMATGTVGVPFTYAISATNSPTAFTASGLPDGLALAPSTGVISGTPSTAGATLVSIFAINASGTGSANLGITIAPVPGQSGSATATSPGGSSGGGCGLGTGVAGLIGLSFLTLRLRRLR